MPRPLFTCAIADLGRYVAACALLAVAATLALGCEEPSTSDLTVTVLGEAYPRVRCAKGPKSLGQVFPDGAPVTGAEVVLNPGNLRARTNTAGQLILRSVPAGRYQLYITRAGYRPEPPRTVIVPATTRVTASIMPCVTVVARRAVGFNKPVTLRTRNLCGADWDGASASWRQLEGPKIDASVTRWTDATLEFTTASIEKTRGSLPNLPTVLSFSRDQAGEYVFQLEARSKSGKVSTSYGFVSATDVTTGLTSVPPGRRYYFVGPAKGPWKWKLVSAPAGWKVSFEGEDTRTPSVLPIAPGAITSQSLVTVQEQTSLLTFSLVIGDWNIVRRDCGRAECHAAMQGNWAGTKHASSWQRLLDGEIKLARGRASERCAACHSMGYNTSIDDGGHDDQVRRAKLSFPTQLQAGNFSKLPATVKNTANVYCLACHGPARVDPPVAEQPGLFQVGVCASCHDRLPEQYTVAQWRTSKHAKTVGTDINGPDRRRECAKCHTAQGFYSTFVPLSRPHASRTAVLTCCENPAPVGCQACHNAMIGKHPRQLHLHGSTTLPSGLKLRGVAGAALCSTCHNAGHDPDSTKTLDARSAPHAAQADLAYGRAGYSLDVSKDFPQLAGIACSKKTKAGCVTCHMHPGPPAGSPGFGQLGGHTFKMRKDKLSNLAACQSCHPGMASFNPPAKGDYDGDGQKKGIRDEITTLATLLKREVDAAIAQRAYKGCASSKPAGASFKAGYRQKIVIVDAKGKDLGDCDQSGGIERLELPYLFPNSDLLLHKAAYNYLVIKRDASGGIHNAPYAVKLLQRSIAALRALRSAELPKWEIRQ